MNTDQRIEALERRVRRLTLAVGLLGAGAVLAVGLGTVEPDDDPSPIGYEATSAAPSRTWADADWIDDLWVRRLHIDEAILVGDIVDGDELVSGTIVKPGVALFHGVDQENHVLISANGMSASVTAQNSRDDQSYRKAEFFASRDTATVKVSDYAKLDDLGLGRISSAVMGTSDSQPGLLSSAFGNDAGQAGGRLNMAFYSAAGNTTMQAEYGDGDYASMLRAIFATQIKEGR